jgi:hypothetical protein
MSEKICTYRGNREEAIVEFVYDEMATADRAAFEVHLAACALCRDEISGVRGVQEQLASWEPPAPGVLTDTKPAESGRVLQVPASRWGRLRDVPMWARAAAAVVAVGVASGAANLDLRYDADGLSVRTGWTRGAPAAVTAAPITDAWRADLAASEERLRAELRRVADSKVAAAEPAAARMTVAGGDAVGASVSERAGLDRDALARVRALVTDSERRQQRELALRVAEVFRDVQAQRQSDLVKIDRSLGLLQNSTGIEVARQRELINSLAVRVSQRQ